MKTEILEALLEAFEGCPSNFGLSELKHPDCGNTNPTDEGECHNCWIKAITQKLEQKESEPK